MKDFKKNAIAVSVVVVGVIIALAANKAFGIDRSVDRIASKLKGGS